MLSNFNQQNTIFKKTLSKRDCKSTRKIVKSNEEKQDKKLFSIKTNNKIDKNVFNIIDNSNIEIIVLIK